MARKLWADGIWGSILTPWQPKVTNLFQVGMEISKFQLLGNTEQTHICQTIHTMQTYQHSHSELL